MFLFFLVHSETTKIKEVQDIRHCYSQKEKTGFCLNMT